MFFTSSEDCDVKSAIVILNTLTKDGYHCDNEQPLQHQIEDTTLSEQQNQSSPRRQGLIQLPGWRMDQRIESRKPKTNKSTESELYINISNQGTIIEYDASGRIIRSNAGLQSPDRSEIISASKDVDNNPPCDVLINGSSGEVLESDIVPYLLPLEVVVRKNKMMNSITKLDKQLLSLRAEQLRSSVSTLDDAKKCITQLHTGMVTLYTRCRDSLDTRNVKYKELMSENSRVLEYCRVLQEKSIEAEKTAMQAASDALTIKADFSSEKSKILSNYDTLRFRSEEITSHNRELLSEREILLTTKSALVTSSQKLISDIQRRDEQIEDLTKKCHDTELNWTRKAAVLQLRLDKALEELRALTCYQVGPARQMSLKAPHQTYLGNVKEASFERAKSQLLRNLSSSEKVMMSSCDFDGSEKNETSQTAEEKTHKRSNSKTGRKRSIIQRKKSIPIKPISSHNVDLSQRTSLYFDVDEGLFAPNSRLYPATAKLIAQLSQFSSFILNEVMGRLSIFWSQLRLPIGRPGGFNIIPYRAVDEAREAFAELFKDFSSVVNKSLARIEVSVKTSIFAVANCERYCESNVGIGCAEAETQTSVDNVYSELSASEKHVLVKTVQSCILSAQKRIAELGGDIHRSEVTEFILDSTSNDLTYQRLITALAAFKKQLRHVGERHKQFSPLSCSTDGSVRKPWKPAGSAPSSPGKLKSIASTIGLLSRFKSAGKLRASRRSTLSSPRSTISYSATPRESFPRMLGTRRASSPASFSPYSESPSQLSRLSDDMTPSSPTSCSSPRIGSNRRVVLIGEEL